MPSITLTAGTATPGSPGGGTSNAIVTRETYAPEGSLGPWKDVATLAASGLFEMPTEGDSTTHGMADPNLGVAQYTWVQRARDRAIQAGLPFGGYGNYNFTDYLLASQTPNWSAQADGYPRTVAHVKAGVSGFGHSASAAIWSMCSHDPGDSVTVEFKGNLRLLKYNNIAGTTHGSFSISIDGGPTINHTLYDTPPFSTDNPYVCEPVWYDLDQDAAHTITVVNTSTGGRTIAELGMEFVRDSGLVWHRDAINGATTGTWADAVTLAAATQSVTPMWLGLLPPGRGASVNGRSWGRALGPRPQYRNAKLAIMQITTNDMNVPPENGTAAAEAALENLGMWARMVKASGAGGLILCPPLEVASGGIATGDRHMTKFKNATRSVAESYGLAWHDFGAVLGPVSGWPAMGYGSGGPSTPHLSAKAYKVQADRLWDVLLAPYAGLPATTAPAL